MAPRSRPAGALSGQLPATPAWPVLPSMLRLFAAADESDVVGIDTKRSEQCNLVATAPRRHPHNAPGSSTGSIAFSRIAERALSAAGARGDRKAAALGEIGDGDGDRA